MYVCMSACVFVKISDQCQWFCVYVDRHDEALYTTKSFRNFFQFVLKFTQFNVSGKKKNSGDKRKTK